MGSGVTRRVASKAQDDVTPAISAAGYLLPLSLRDAVPGPATSAAPSDPPDAITRDPMQRPRRLPMVKVAFETEFRDTSTMCHD